MSYAALASLVVLGFSLYLSCWYGDGHAPRWYCPGCEYEFCEACRPGAHDRAMKELLGERYRPRGE